ncbi:MAG TPA: FAD-dependent oxidoreductase [Actinomycetota bacterium]|nr:FAD-dependent oxidoreductase [Actinomycetota bacterium]
MARVLILGGGFGGVSAAHHLRRLAPDHEVVLIDAGTRFMMGFRKTDELVGRETMAAGSRPLAALEGGNVTVRRGHITRVDPAGRAAEVDGERLEGEAMVVALGAETVPGAVPGLAENGLNAYDPAVVPRAAEALAAMAGGRLVIGIFGAPYTCPPAPYELALLAKEAAEARGVALDVTVFTPQPMSLPVLGPAGCQVVEGRLARRGISFRPNTRAERVDPGEVVVEGGGGIPFDLLLAIPPHRVPPLLVEAGLAEEGGWVEVEPSTLETRFEGVFAVGDCVGIALSTGMPMPKAGVLAAEEGRVAAERIAARLAGNEPEATFDGRGECYLEVGGGEAMVVRGRFLAEPGPQVELVPASAANLEEKRRSERDRLDEWFGPAA